MKNADEPAYPCDVDVNPRGEQSGMSKREAFAMAAMQGLLSKEGWAERICNEAVTEFSLATQIAYASVRMADELLKQLES